MSPWTALLESLHSSLLAEFRERDADEIIEVGLPSRHATWTLPNSLISPPLRLIAIGQEFDFQLRETDPMSAVGVTGVVVGGSDFDQEEVRRVWTQTLNRSASEFSRKGIKPRFLPPNIFDPTQPSPIQPSRLIWLPFAWRNQKVALFLAAK